MKLCHHDSKKQPHRLTPKTKLDIHDHAFIKFDDGTFVIYNDQRRFGFIDLTEEEIFTNKFLKKLGPDSLSKKFNVTYLSSILKYKERKIKNILVECFTKDFGSIFSFHFIIRA